MVVDMVYKISTMQIAFIHNIIKMQKINEEEGSSLIPPSWIELQQYNSNAKEIKKTTIPEGRLNLLTPSWIAMNLKCKTHTL
jgi:hypothetical protein